MKKKIYLYLLLFSTFFILSCNVSLKHLQRGEYHTAVMRSVSKLQRKPTKEKEILVLEEAYPKAMQINKDRIKFLHTEGQPDRWEEIFNIYSTMKARQIFVETVTPLQIGGRTVDFKHVDYDKSIVNAKQRAAAYFYAHGKKLMQANDRLAYRQAFNEFNKAKHYVTSYYDIDSLLIVCKDLGTTQAILVVVNNTFYKFQNDFMINLIDHPTGDLNSFWVMYHTQDSRNGNYDINVYVALTIADVSANAITENRRTESKEVQDGWDYALDAHGNIKKDTLGNPIKVKRYKTIRCDVIETIQFKEAHLEGEIKYEDVYSKQILRSFPIAADHRFEWVYTIANGNLDALSNETRRSLGNKPVPYPHDMDMLWGVNETLRSVIRNSLFSNKDVLERW